MARHVQADVHPADVPGHQGVDAQPESAVGDREVGVGRFIQNQAELGAESAGGGDDPDVAGLVAGKKAFQFLQGAWADAYGAVASFPGVAKLRGVAEGRAFVRSGHGQSPVQKKYKARMCSGHPFLSP
jgi:hypothetical protein